MVIANDIVNLYIIVAAAGQYPVAPQWERWTAIYKQSLYVYRIISSVS